MWEYLFDPNPNTHRLKIHLFAKTNGCDKRYRVADKFPPPLGEKCFIHIFEANDTQPTFHLQATHIILAYQIVTTCVGRVPSREELTYDLIDTKLHPPR